ncbi:hypothetical protein [Ligilactobacillus saerimneri]|uniref:hypothetical protein n=1 Tax=Ligilactobacillus saerimneri TaxID=228229 RepID=UPI001C0FAFB4|nr:hypothetical protein [Ligilactobacillus saerimneri]MBU5308871.1 hypothetical protein [Ligilactobacillus saerimneri]
MNAYKDMIDSLKLNKIKSELAKKNFSNLVAGTLQREVDERRQAERSKAWDERQAKFNDNVKKQEIKKAYYEMNNNWYYWFH